MDSNENHLKQSFDEYLGEEIIKVDDLRAWRIHFQIGFNYGPRASWNGTSTIQE